ncbi:MAG: hypothetical protein C1943_02065 [Halochromatium sp.]|nr:hypothetical protein [Halochromatium sp.]
MKKELARCSQCASLILLFFSYSSLLLFLSSSLLLFLSSSLPLFLSSSLPLFFSSSLLLCAFASLREISFYDVIYATWHHLIDIMRRPYPLIKPLTPCFILF